MLFVVNNQSKPWIQFNLSYILIVMITGYTSVCALERLDKIDFIFMF